MSYIDQHQPDKRERPPPKLATSEENANTRSTQQGNRRHLPWVSVPSSGTSAAGASVGLPHRRYPLTGFLTLTACCPTNTLWLCFKPLPPIGFTTFRAFPTRPAAAPLSAPCSPAVGRPRIEASFDLRSPPLRLLGGVPSRNALKRRATSAPELCSGRASDTLRRAFRSAPGRCSLGLRPLRGFQLNRWA